MEDLKRQPAVSDLPVSSHEPVPVARSNLPYLRQGFLGPTRQVEDLASSLVKRHLLTGTADGSRLLADFTQIQTTHHQCSVCNDMAG